MRRTAAGLGLVLVLAGCASEHWMYDRPRVTPAELDRDVHACRREAFRPSRFAIWPSQRYDQEALNRCMIRRGYTPRPVE